MSWQAGLALLLLSLAACGEIRQIERELASIERVSSYEVQDESEEAFGGPQYAAELELRGGGTLTIFDIRLAHFDRPRYLRIDQAGGWLPRCGLPDGSGWILGVNVIQPPDSSFIPGVVGSVRDLVENYDAVVEALEAWPHDPEKAAEVRLDGETMRCYAAQLQ